MSRETVFKRQAERQKKYPKDRICFHPSEYVANRDIKNFRAFYHGDISIYDLCRITADSNYLRYVNETQMINELKMIGWIRNDWKPTEENKGFYFKED